MKKATMIITLLLFGISLVNGRSFRVSQIPNGNKFGCLNCHTGSGGPRNPFGQAVGSDFLDNGNVQWGATLAALDSDGDGKTNGEELADPVGKWTVGTANPGDVDLVSNPGDPSSTTAILTKASELPNSFHMMQNYPNPFNPSTTISFTIPKKQNVTLRIYNALGHPIKDVLNEELAPGRYSIVWHGVDQNGESVGAGVYLASFESEAFRHTVRMLYIK